MKRRRSTAPAGMDRLHARAAEVATATAVLEESCVEVAALGSMAAVRLCADAATVDAWLLGHRAKHTFVARQSGENACKFLDNLAEMLRVSSECARALGKQQLLWRAAGGRGGADATRQLFERFASANASLLECETQVPAVRLPLLVATQLAFELNAQWMAASPFVRAFNVEPQTLWLGFALPVRTTRFRESARVNADALQLEFHGGPSCVVQNRSDRTFVLDWNGGTVDLSVRVEAHPQQLRDHLLLRYCFKYRRYRFNYGNTFRRDTRVCMWPGGLGVNINGQRLTVPPLARADVTAALASPLLASFRKMVFGAHCLEFNRLVTVDFPRAVPPKLQSMFGAAYDAEQEFEFSKAVMDSAASGPPVRAPALNVAAHALFKLICEQPFFKWVELHFTRFCVRLSVGTCAVIAPPPEEYGEGDDDEAREGRLDELLRTEAYDILNRREATGSAAEVMADARALLAALTPHAQVILTAKASFTLETGELSECAHDNDTTWSPDASPALHFCRRALGFYGSQFPGTTPNAAVVAERRVFVA